MTPRPLSEPAIFPTTSWLAGRSRAARWGSLLIGTALLALSAHIAVPFWPVPMSMQTLVVLLIGFAMGARLGGATVLAYFVEGAIGLPVFHGGGGFAYFAGPTGGYLIGFLPAVMLVGALAERGATRSLLRTAAAALLGDVLIFACGLTWLAIIVGPAKSLAFGLIPFLPAEAVKLALAIAIAPLLRRGRG